MSPDVESTADRIETHVLSVVGKGGKPTGGLWSSIDEITIGAAVGDHHSLTVISQIAVLSKLPFIKV